MKRSDFKVLIGFIKKEVQKQVIIQLADILKEYHLVPKEADVTTSAVREALDNRSSVNVERTDIPKVPEPDRVKINPNLTNDPVLNMLLKETADTTSRAELAAYGVDSSGEGTTAIDVISRAVDPSQVAIGFDNTAIDTSTPEGAAVVNAINKDYSQFMKDIL